MSSHPKSGTLYVRPISAKLIRDVELVGIMDPYCVIKIGEQIISSRICENGGKAPHWNDQLVFRVTGDETMKVTIIDRRSMIGDEEIGSAIIHLSSLSLAKKNVFED